MSTKEYRFTCDTCGGHELTQDACVDLNSGELSWQDAIYCNDCDCEVEVSQNRRVKPANIDVEI